MRTWIIALAALMVLPAVGAAATIAVKPVGEQLVEGHTVFTVIEVRNATNVTQEEFHAAVAVLVREVNQRASAFRFPGVLWFNDQYLVNPTSSVSRVIDARYPCTGAVVAVDVTYGDPRADAAGLNPLHVDDGGNYVESYHITDPNDNAWDVDKWRTATGFVWTVALNNQDGSYSVPDDGTSNCNPKYDMGDCNTFGTMNYGNVPGVDQVRDDSDVIFNLNPGERDTRDNNPARAGGWCKYQYKDPGVHGYGYPCGQDDPAGSVDPPRGHYNCPNLLYNAVLYFRIQDLASAGAPKDHTDGSVDSTSDVSGCHPSYGYYGGDDGSEPNPYSGPSGDFYDRPFRTWPCPAGNDDREGNSHPYNPEIPWPGMAYDGRYNHGGSADCDGDGVADQPKDANGNDVRDDYTGDYLCHATRNINIYYHVAVKPAVRKYYLIDNVGSEAPFHCHDAREVCNASELLQENPDGRGGADGYANDGSEFAGNQPYG